MSISDGLVAALAELTNDQVMAERFQLVEDISIIQGRHNAELAPLNEALKLCEQYIKAFMLEHGMQQNKTEAGMAFFTTKDSVTVKDMDGVIDTILNAALPPPPGALDAVSTPIEWQSVLDYIHTHALWGLL